MVMDERFDAVLQRRLEAKNAMDRAKAVMAECDIEIMAAMDLTEQTCLVWEHGGTKYDVIKRKGGKPRETLDKITLLNNGVSAELIQKATKLGEPGKPGITVRKSTDKDDE